METRCTRDDRAIVVSIHSHARARRLHSGWRAPDDRSTEEIMNSKWISALAIAASSMALSGVALAQEKDQSVATKKNDAVAPVRDAVEITVGTGYAQGFGDVGANRPTLIDVGQPGGAVQVGVGYRIIPQLSLGI